MQLGAHILDGDICLACTAQYVMLTVKEPKAESMLHNGRLQQVARSACQATHQLP